MTGRTYVRFDDLFEAVVLRLPHRLRVRLSRALARGSQVVEPPACADRRCCFQSGTRTVTMKSCSPLYGKTAEDWPAGGNWEGGYVNSAGERWRHVPNVGWERR